VKLVRSYLGALTTNATRRKSTHRGGQFVIQCGVQFLKAYQARIEKILSYEASENSQANITQMEVIEPIKTDLSSAYLEELE